MFIDGKRECATLEDVVRPAGEKVYGQTAIPAGRYRVIVNVSNRFKRELPLLLNVPNFEGIRIHRGNKHEDTQGCILVGDTNTSYKDDFIGNSKQAEERVVAKIKKAIALGEEVWITIKNA